MKETNIFFSIRNNNLKQKSITFILVNTFISKTNVFKSQCRCDHSYLCT